MKLLLITPRVPYPPYRGDKLKIFNLIRRLSSRNSIHLVTFVESQEDLDHLPQLHRYCSRIDVVPLPKWLSLLHCLRGVFSSIPLQVHYFRTKRMRRLIDALCKANHYDVIHTHLIRMAQYTADQRHGVKILDLTDAVSVYLERFLTQEKNWLKRLLLNVELRRMNRYEEILHQFDISLVCSEPDKKALHKTAPLADIRILPNGIDLEYFSSNGAISYDPESIIFTGNLSYFPNTDGALFFVKEIFPLIKRELPAAKLYIVGQSPPASVSALASEDIIVTGFVEDIRLFYLRSAVAISPIRFGAGTLNKVLEPLSLGVPVVATSVGIEGLGLTLGRDIMVADDPRAFAAHVVRILKDPQLRERLGQDGMNKVRRQYDWDDIVETLESYYQEIKETSNKLVVMPSGIQPCGSNRLRG